jgi:hypothetical protein
MCAYRRWAAFQLVPSASSTAGSTPFDASSTTRPLRPTPRPASPVVPVRRREERWPAPTSVEPDEQPRRRRVPGPGHRAAVLPDRSTPGPRLLRERRPVAVRGHRPPGRVGRRSHPPPAQPTPGRTRFSFASNLAELLAHDAENAGETVPRVTSRVAASPNSHLPLRRLPSTPRPRARATAPRPPVQSRAGRRDPRSERRGRPARAR